MFRFESLALKNSQNPKHKREVCRYWLQSKCQKGSSCEFLHAINYDRMPECPAGLQCTVGSACPFRHTPVEARDVCANYALGFCSFGRRCTHAHVQLGAEALPEVSPFWTYEYPALKRSDRLYTANRRYRSAECSYSKANGWCPYFDMCNFKHE